MNKADKYVSMPNEDQPVQLKDLMKNSHSAGVRMRSRSTVLSSEGYDKSCRSKPPALTGSETGIVRELIKEHPHSPGMISAKVSEKKVKLSVFPHQSAL
jgi:hypothetical protein